METLAIRLDLWLLMTGWTVVTETVTPPPFQWTFQIYILFVPIQWGNLYVASVNTTKYGLRSQKFTGPRLWNSLPTGKTNSNSLRIFR